MSNKVYLVQKSPIVGRLNYSTRQTVIPHVITHAPVVRVIQNTPPQTEDLNETDILDFDRPQQKTRRRERLNHLTPEQKMDRRKMKNREAAQNARDRKKMQGQQMEQKLKIMAAEIRQLRTENAKLRAQLNNQQTQQYIPSEYDSMSTKALTEKIPAVDYSGSDEFFVQSPTYPSECVEVYAPTETYHQANEMSVYQPEFVEETQQWNSAESAPNSYVPSAQQQPPVTQLPDQDQAGEYYKLVQSEFVNEIARELPLWNEDPCFAKEVANEGAALVQEEIPEQEMIPADIDDLYDYIWHESF